MRDVVIVGGGPVGMLLACLLAGRGLDILVVEQRETPARLSRAIGIHPPSLLALRQAGVLDEVLAGAARIRDGEVWSGGARLGRMSFGRLPTEHQFVASLPQHVTEELLAARLESLQPGALRRGVRVTATHTLWDRVEVVLEHAQERETLEARFVVGADGARSSVRAAAGIRWQDYGHSETYLMADFPADAAFESVAVLYFERAGVVESLPLPGGRRRWVALTDGLRPGAGAEELADIIRSRTGVEVPQTTDVPSAFTARQRLAGRMVAGRTVLVGDAAHEISPIGGQGMNLGWLDAMELAPALEQAIREERAAPAVPDLREAPAVPALREAPAVPAVPELREVPALQSYDRNRRAKARMAMRQAGFNMAMGRPSDGVQLRTRNGLVRMLAVPPADAVLARAFTMRWL